MLSILILLYSYRVLPVKANVLPTASFTYSPQYPQPYELVTFDASGSYDPDGSIVRYEWRFGDGYEAIGTTPVVGHTYTADGTYQVILTVVDNEGGYGATYVDLVVNCNVWFRVVNSMGNPISGVNVTLYYGSSDTATNWYIAPTGYNGMEIKYDNITAPGLADTPEEKYRNPGITAKILRDTSNIGIEIHPSTWYVFFKFQWGPNVIYWPNESRRVLSYDYGDVDTHYYSYSHRARLNDYAHTYVIKSSYIPGDNVNPKSCYPILVGFQTVAQLTVSISPSLVTMDVGQSQTFTSTVLGGTLPYSYQWYLNGNPVSGATNPTWTYTPTSAGSYMVYLNVTDSTCTTVKSNVATVTVNPALSVTIVPTSVVMDVGQSQLFTSTISGGTSPCSYQWYLNGAPVSGATSPTWAFTPTSSGSYTVYVNVTDNVGVKAKSNIASVTVNPTLSTSVLPASATMDVGQSKLFTSTVSGGTSPYTYQWYLNGNPVSGATNPTWTFSPSSAGSYTIYLKVTDAVGAVATSNNVPVTVNGQLSVTIAPSSKTLDVGQSQLFTSSVCGGTSPYTYQWYLNGNPVSGATNPTWTFTPSSPGSYTVYVNVTDSVGVKVKSNVASVTVNSAPSVTISPSSVTMDVGQSQLFQSTVSGGTLPYTYQWYLNGNPVSGATNPTWTFSPSSAGSYTVYLKVTDNAGVQVTSNTVPVTVNGALSVTIAPISVTMDVGQSQLFTSSVSGGTSPYTYQWYLNGNPVSGGTNPTWTFTPISSGFYTVYLIVTDGVSASATSDTANVNVNPQLQVTISPSSATIYRGQSQLFTSSVSGGTSPYFYQWYLDGAPVSGATNPTWTFTPTTTGIYQIYLKVTDDVNVIVQSNTAQLTVNSPPSVGVTISPSAAVIDIGQSVDFTSTVTGGTPPFSYQWYLDGNPVSGATNPAWTFTPSSSGNYQVYLKVTDSLNVEGTSNTASVAVNPLPSVTISPTSATIDLGQIKTFTSSVSGGTSPYTYQWYLDGNPVSGATDSTWMFSPASTGTYQVYLIVTDSVDESATSNTATVTVNPALFLTVSPTSVVMDVGQCQQLTSTVSGGTLPYTYQWYLDYHAVLGATNPNWIFCPISPGTYIVFVEVSDSADVDPIIRSVLIPVTVNPAPTVTIAPTSLTIDIGQSKQFTSTVSGGTLPYTYQWYLDGNPVSGATNPTWTFTPSSSGSYNVYVNVTDNVGVQAKSNTATVTVNPALSVTISPTLVTMDVGQSQLFTSTVSGGTSPFSYQWYLNGSPVSGATSPGWTFTPTSPGSYSVYVVVTDSADVDPSAQSPPAQVTVNLPPTVTIAPPSVVMDVGQSQLFTSTISGGSPPLLLQWYLNGAPVPGANLATWTFTPASAGLYTVYLQVTDTVGMQAVSNIAHVTVNGWPTVTINPTSATIYVGNFVGFTSTVSGGTTPYSYQWYLNGNPVSGATNSTWTFSPVSAGFYTVYLNITDSVGARAKSNAANVTVLVGLAVSISPPSASVTVGHSVSFISSVTGGVTPYYYQWYVNGSQITGATLPTWTFTPTVKGTYLVHLNVTDSMGKEAKSNVAKVTATSVIPVGGRSVSINTLQFLAPWVSMISLLAAAVMLKGIIAKKKRT
jgi:PKD repeat protein